MINQEDFERAGCHDSAISEFRKTGTTLLAVFSNVLLYIGEEIFYEISVKFRGVANLSRNDVVVMDVSVESDDSTVPDFRRDNGTVTLILTWNYYNTAREHLAIYKWQIVSADFKGVAQTGLLT